MVSNPVVPSGARSWRVCLSLLLATVMLSATGCSAAIALAIAEIINKSGSDSSNSLPTVTVGSIARVGAGDVIIPVTVNDGDDDTVTLTAVYHVGASGPFTATLVGNTTATGTAAGANLNITWDADGDLGSTAYQSNISIFFTGNDGTSNGPTGGSTSFEYGNDAPQLLAVSVDTDVNGEVGDIAAVRFTVSDSSSDDIDVTSFEYSLLGDFTDAVTVTLSTGQGGNFPVGTLTGLSTDTVGLDYSFAWNVLLSVEINLAGAAIRMGVTDSLGGTSTIVASPTFTLHTAGDPPSAFIVNVKEPDIDGERTGVILIIYELFDSEDHPSDIRVEFSTDDGVNWNTCTEYPGVLSEGIYELAANDDGVQHFFLWDSPVDLVQNPATIIRIVPADISGIGQPVETPFRLNIGLSDFQEVQTYFTGGASFGGATGDVTGDGSIDLIVPNAQSDTVTVLEQQTDHTFVGAAFDVNGVSPRAVGVGNFGGSSANDIVVVNANDDTVTILQNDAGGTGDFTTIPPVTFGSGGTTPVDVVVGIFDPGIVPDIAVVNQNTDTLRVFTGNGDGTFNVYATLSTGGSPKAVAAGQFTAGVDTDFAVCNRDDSNVSIFTSNGDSTYNSSVVSVAGSPTDITTAQLNPGTDSNVDLVVSHPFDNRITLMFGDGAGGFTTNTIGALGGPASVVPIDQDGDGDQDLAVVLQNLDRVAIFINNGTGSFTLSNVYTTDNLPGFIVSDDFNLDSRPDLLVTHQTTGVTASVFQSRSDDERLFATADDYFVNSSPSRLATADLDYDGNLDLVVTGDGDGNVAILRGFGDGTFSVNQFIDIGGAVASPEGIAFADVDGDELLDILIAKAGSNEVHVLIGDGDLGFSDGTGVSTSSGPEAILLADFDGDNLVDLAVAETNADQITVFIGDGNGGFTSDNSYSTDQEPCSLALGDFNNDGVPDLITTCRASNSAQVLTAQGGGSFNVETPLILANAGPFQVEAAYLGQDPELDAIVVTQTGTLEVLKGGGDGTLSTALTRSLSGPGGGMAIADINGDGIIDMLGSNISDNRVFLFLGIGAGDFAATGIQIPGGFQPEGLVIADFNHDATPDMALAKTAEDLVGVFIGRRTGRDFAVDAVAFVAGPETGNIVGTGTIPAENDAFAAAKKLQIGIRRYQAFSDDEPDDLRDGNVASAPDFANRVRLNATTLPNVMEPLTRPWVVSGDLRAHQDRDRGSTNTGKRLEVMARFGGRVSPDDDTDLRRLGFDLSSATFASQRGMVIDLPIRTTRSVLEMNTAFAADRIHVYQRRTTWVTANQIPIDPNTGDVAPNFPPASRFLPRVDFGLGYRDFIIEQYVWVKIPRATGNLSDDQAGARFVMADLVDLNNRRVRVLTDSGGIFQAFYEP